MRLMATIVVLFVGLKAAFAPTGPHPTTHIFYSDVDHSHDPVR